MRSLTKSPSQVEFNHHLLSEIQQSWRMFLLHCFPWTGHISTCLPFRSVLQDKDAWGPLFNKTSRPRDDDETVESLWSDWDIPRRMMQALSWGMQC
jgi:hypothetical protein